MDRDELCGRRLGEFILRERIAEGGFGTVYRSEQPLLGREAVVKVLHHGLRRSEVVIQRFMREAQLASRLDHPYAAHIYAFGVDHEDGLMWIAMELVHGTTLQSWLRDRGKLPLDRLVPFFERVAEVVHTAHEHGIVHRDLKPSNIMVIERAGRLLPKLLDFGIAKLHEPDVIVLEPRRNVADTRVAVIATAPTVTLGVSHEPPAKLPSQLDTLPPAPDETPPTPASAPLTRADATMGSPPYMSPEQWVEPSLVGPRSDVYSLAIVAYEALVGCRPFSAPTLAGLAQLHCEGEVPPLGDGFPPALDALFRRALAKRPEDRPTTALELVAELRVAAGLDTAVTDLPRLDDGVRDSWLADAPQPLAEAVAALEGARNVHQARDAARELLRGLLRYLLALALAARAQVRSGRDEPALLELLRALRRRDLDDAERLRMLRLSVKPFENHRGAHPIPDLLDIVAADSLDPIVTLHLTSDSGGNESVVRSQLVQLVAELSRLLHAAAFVLDYALVVPRNNAGERWVGLRRQRRALATVHGHELVDRQPILIDSHGRTAVLVWPLIQVATPAPGAEPELFVFDGHGRLGARLIAAPAGFEHHDPSVWDWLAEHVIGEAIGPDDAASDDRPPYLGLAAFSEADADRFVGREREIDVFVNRLRQRPMQIVVGASGAGKSSFVQAGIVPALPAGWRTITMRPGATPLVTLAARLSSITRSTTDLRPVLEGAPAAAAALVAHAAGDGAIIVVIDQLEELFTLCSDPAERERFAAVLSELGHADAEHTRVICTLRDDFLMQAEALAPLRALLSPSLFLLGNPSRDDLARTIVEPARRAGYELSDGDLAKDMVAAVAERPGALALVSFTASRLWELRDRRFRQLTRSAYDAMGGIGGALRHHADATLDALAADDQRIARDAFRHLVMAEGTRAVLTARELRERLAEPRAAAVIDKLVTARLLSVSDGEREPEIEIIHEALIAAWPRLQQWLHDDAEGARTRDALRSAAKQWHERARPRGSLWRDDVLAELERYRRTDPALTDVEIAFADGSRAEARRTRLIRRGLAGAAFVMLAAAVVVLFELNSVTRDQREQAETSEREMRHRIAEQHVEQGRLSLLAGRSSAALAYFGAALDAGIERDVALDFMISEAARAIRAGRSVIRAHDGPIETLDVTSDGTQLVTAGNDKVARIWDRVSMRQLATLHVEVQLNAARFDPTGRYVIATGTDGVVRLFSVLGTLIRELREPGEEVMRSSVFPAFDRSGRRVATIKNSTDVEVWDVDTLRVTHVIKSGLPFVDRVVFSPDGSALAVSGAGLCLIDPTSGKVRAKLEGHTEEVVSIAFSPDGHLLASGSVDHTARLWDVTTGRPIARLQGHADIVDNVEFGSKGLIVTASRDHTARIWNIEGDILRILDGHGGRVTTARFDLAQARVVTASADGSARVWDVDTGMQLAAFEGHIGKVVDAAFAGDDVMTAGADGTLRRWDPRSGARILWHHDAPIQSAELSSDGVRLVTASLDGSARVWNLESGQLAATLAGPGAPSVGQGAWHYAAFSSDGRTVLVYSAGVTTLWRDGIAVRTLNHLKAPTFIAGGRIAAATADGLLQLVDVETGTVTKTVRAPFRVFLLAPHPSSARLLVATDDGVRSWNTTTGDLVEFARGTVVRQVVPVSDELVAGADNDGRVWLWRSNGTLVHEFPRQAGPVWRVTASDDGRFLACASRDGDIQVWNLHQPGYPRQSLIHDLSLASTITFDPSGELLVTGGVDDHLKVWRTSDGQLASTARSDRGGIYTVIASERFIASAGNAGIIVVRDRLGPIPLPALRSIIDCLPVELANGRIVSKTIDSSCH